MRFFTLLLGILLMLCSCAKEDKLNPSYIDNVGSGYIKKIIPAPDGLWAITSIVEESRCDYCSQVFYVDGLIYSSSSKTKSLDKIGTLLDAEPDEQDLVVLSPGSVSRYDSELKSEVIKNAEPTEEYKLMCKAGDGKFWILSNKAIFSLDGERISLSKNFPAIDFEVTSGHSFWIATSDTVYYIQGTTSEKYEVNNIYGAPSNVATSVPTIFGLRLDKSDTAWINTPDKLFKLDSGLWKNVKVGSYSMDNFKTIPFLDIDKDGRLWVAEKNYQAFTDLHMYKDGIWTNVKLDTPLTSWITDIEAAETGYIWIGTNKGMLKLRID